MRALFPGVLGNDERYTVSCEKILRINRQT